MAAGLVKTNRAMISFVIPAFNEELTLPGCVESIRNAMHTIGGDCEIIVANDASTDATVTLAAKLGCRVVECRNRQIAATRNAGARAAMGDVLIFVDADTRVSGAVVRASLDTLAAGCVGGSARLELEGFIPWWGRLFFAMFSVVYFAMNLGAGSFFFVTREAFERAGGFDERYFAGEETHLSIALKRIGRFKVLRTPVLTSGRKMRTSTMREHFAQLFTLMLGGVKATHSRDKLPIWYDGRREGGFREHREE
jgi:glycosyltransferase involved in cell wall biosynthesis